MSAHRARRTTAVATIPAATLIAAHGGTVTTSPLLARGRRATPPSLARGLILAAALAGTVVAGAGVASADTNPASTAAHLRYSHPDLTPAEPCGIECQAPAPDQSEADLATGAETWGVPGIFVLGLIILF